MSEGMEVQAPSSQDAAAAVKSLFSQDANAREAAPTTTVVPVTGQPQQAPPVSTDQLYAQSVTAPAQQVQQTAQDPAQTATAQRQDNPLPEGVRYRLAQEADARRQAQAELAQTREEMARMRGYLEAQMQAQQQGRQQAPQMPDMIQDPQGYAAYVRAEAERAADAKIAAAQQSVGQQMQALAQNAARAQWASDEAIAVQKYGAEYVEQVKQHIASNNLGNRYSYNQDGSPRSNPFTSAISDIRMAQAQQAIPNWDVEAFKRQAVMEAMNNPAVMAQYAQQSRAQAPMGVPPPSLSSMPRSNGQPPAMRTEDAVAQLFASRR